MNVSIPSSDSPSRAEEVEAFSGGAGGERPDVSPVILRVPAIFRRPFRSVRARAESLAAGDVGTEETTADGYPIGKRLAEMEREWRTQEAVLRAAGRSEPELAEARLNFTMGFWRAEVTRPEVA